MRNEAILRVFLLWLLNADDAVAFFDDEIEVHLQRLEGFEQTLANDEQQRREHGTANGGIQFTSSLALEWAFATNASTSPGRSGHKSRSPRDGKAGTASASAD